MKCTWICVCVVLIGFKITGVGGQPNAVRSCSTGWHFYEEQCYSYFLTTLPWVAAGRACNKHGGQLVAILEEETQIFLEGMLKYSDSDYWLGLQYDGTERQWRWWGGGFVTEYSNWASLFKQRQNEDKTVLCGYIIGRLRQYQSGSVDMWGQTDCNTRKRFICQKPPTLYKYTCDDGWFLHDNMCFHGYQTPESWVVARKLCRKTHTNGDLVTIGTQDLQQIINSAIVERRVNYWTGLHYDRSSKDWIWLDIGKPDYSNWAPSLPDSSRRQRGQECMYLIGGLKHRFYNEEPLLLGMWDHGTCESKLYFFCQKPASMMELPAVQPDTQARLTKGPVRSTNPTPRARNTTGMAGAASEVSPGSDQKSNKVAANIKYLMSSVSGGVAVVAALVSSVIIVAVYFQRKGFGCSASKRTEACKDPQNISNSDDSEYATIGDIMERHEPHPIPPVDHVDGTNDICHNGKMGIKVIRISKTKDNEGYIEILDKRSSLKRKTASHKQGLTKRSKDQFCVRHAAARTTYNGQVRGLSGRAGITEPSDGDEEEEDVLFQLDQGQSTPNSYYMYPCQEETTCEPCTLYDFAEFFGQQAVDAVDGSSGGTLSVRDLTYAYEKMIKCTDNEYLDLSADQDGGYEKPVGHQGGTYLNMCGEEDRSTQPL